MKHLIDHSALSDLHQRAEQYRRLSREAERQAEITERNAARIAAWQERFYRYQVELERRECP